MTSFVFLECLYLREGGYIYSLKSSHQTLTQTMWDKKTSPFHIDPPFTLNPFSHLKQKWANFQHSLQKLSDVLQVGQALDTQRLKLLLQEMQN